VGRPNTWFRMTRATLAAALAAALVALAPRDAAAFDFGLSAGTWSFALPLTAAKPAAEDAVEPGLHAKAGAIAGFGRFFELEVYAVPEIAPSPFGALHLGAEATFPLTGSREENYFNAFASLGFLQGVSLEGKPGLSGSRVSLLISPLCIGNPSYLRRDRIFSVGALYELQSGAISLVWSVLTMDFFPEGRR
jgi:hypothetical protein